MRLDKKNRQVIVYLTFVREVPEYGPRGYLPVDVNENSVAVLVDGVAYLLETGMGRLVLGYYYRRRRIQEKYGVNSSLRRKVLRRLKEGRKKWDAR